jgi:hypothetical protein
MSTEIHGSITHTFTPRENTLTAVFQPGADAKRAFPMLAKEGIPFKEVEWISTIDEPESAASNPVAASSSSVPDKALDEILHSLTETFSDDDLDYAEFDRVLVAGGVLLSISMQGRESRRADLAESLRSHGASSVHYWGVLATEKL